jgi:PPOX class probable F420-dependent enzyme
MAFDTLQRARFALLTTRRRDGTPVSTPVWLASDDDHLYVVSRGMGKVKRIKANPEIEIAPCSSRGTAKGPVDSATAVVVPGDLPTSVRLAFRRKYGPFPAIGRLVARLRRHELVLLEIQPRAS